MKKGVMLMDDMDGLISTAIRTTAARDNRTMRSICKGIGFKPTKFYDRLSGRTPWNTHEIDAVAKELGLADGWALIGLAKEEAEIAKRREGEAA